MAFLNEEFIADQLPQGNGGFDPIPAGTYNARITKADIADNKAGTGQYIKLRLDIIGPTHQGRVLFANINIRNASPKAEEIGRQQLGDIMRAIGLAKLSDTDQLIGGELAVKVEVKNDDQYGPGNEIKGYRAIGDKPPAMPSAPAAPAAAAPAPAKSSPPWARK